MKNTCLLIQSYIRRNRIAVLISVICGFVLCLIIYLMGQYVGNTTLTRIKIGVVDYDKSLLSDDFKSYLSEELDYQLIEHDSYDYLSELLIEKDISSIIEIPEGFYDTFAKGQDGHIQITSTDDFENAAFLEAYMNSYLAGIRLLSKGAEGDKQAFEEMIDSYREEEIPISKASAFDLDMERYRQMEGFRNTVGFFLMILFGLGMVLAFMINDDRANGIYNRITITPVKPVQYITGNSIFGLFLYLIMVVIYCGYISLAGIDIGFPVYKLFLLMLLISVFVICFIIDVSIVVRSKSALSSLIIGFSTLGAILGGAYFPIDMAPESLQNLARILPHYWFMDSIRKLMDNPMTDISTNILILALFTVLSFLIGAVLFSQNYKKG